MATNTQEIDPVQERFMGYFDILGFSAIVSNYKKLRSLADLIRWNFISPLELGAEMSRYFIETNDKQLL